MFWHRIVKNPVRKFQISSPVRAMGSAPRRISCADRLRAYQQQNASWGQIEREVNEYLSWVARKRQLAVVPRAIFVDRSADGQKVSQRDAGRVIFVPLTSVAAEGGGCGSEAADVKLEILLRLARIASISEPRLPRLFAVSPKKPCNRVMVSAAPRAASSSTC